MGLFGYNHLVLYGNPYYARIAPLPELPRLTILSLMLIVWMRYPNFIVPKMVDTMNLVWTKRQESQFLGALCPSRHPDGMQQSLYLVGDRLEFKSLMCLMVFMEFGNPGWRHIHVTIIWSWLKTLVSSCSMIYTQSTQLQLDYLCWVKISFTHQ